MVIVTNNGRGGHTVRIQNTCQEDLFFLADAHSLYGCADHEDDRGFLVYEDVPIRAMLSIVAYAQRLGVEVKREAANASTPA